MPKITPLTVLAVRRLGSDQNDRGRAIIEMICLKDNIMLITIFSKQALEPSLLPPLKLIRLNKERLPPLT